MKALVSLQLGNFSRTIMVVDHENNEELARLTKQLCKVKGVTKAVVIMSHLQQVEVVRDGQSPEEVAKTMVNH